MTTATRAPIRANLTKREQEVLALVAQGMTNAQIAERLCLSSHTVQAHLSNLHQKTGTQNRTALAVQYSPAVGEATVYIALQQQVKRLQAENTMLRDLIEAASGILRQAGGGVALGVEPGKASGEAA